MSLGSVIKSKCQGKKVPFCERSLTKKRSRITFAIYFLVSTPASSYNHVQTSTIKTQKGICVFKVMLFVRRAVHIADIYLVVDLNGLFITYIIDVFNIELFLKLSDLAY